MKLPNFIADRMLGKLASRLRMLSFDVEYPDFSTDEELIRRAIFTGRILLTMDSGIRARERLQIYRVRAGRPDEQLMEVLQAFNLLDYFHENLENLLFTRCLECNVPLVSLPREEVRSLVPPYVYETNQEFARCPGCLRVFWAGTHYDNTSLRLRNLIEKARKQR